MAKRSSFSMIGTYLCLAWGVACGGSKPAEAPSPTEGAAKDADAPAADKPSEEKKATPDAKPAEPAKADPPVEEGPKLSRTPKEFVTAPDVLFMLNFNESDVKKEAEAKCEKSSAGDPKKNAECMSKARSQVDHDGFGFKQDKGSWVWTTIKRNGNRLITLHRIPIEFGEETANTITIKTTGKDTGLAPMKPPATVTFEIPNDFQIAKKDPQKGRLVYDAKIGITAE